MTDETYQQILADTVAIQYLIVKAGGMATKSRVEDVLMKRYSFDRGEAHSFTNAAESRSDFMIRSGQVRWEVKTPEPQIEDYPELEP